MGITEELLSDLMRQIGGEGGGGSKSELLWTGRNCTSQI